MADNERALMEKALLEVWSVDRQIKDINDEAYSVFLHHRAEMQLPLRLARMNRAQEQFRELMTRTRDLGQAYADNALNLANEIVTTEKIENYNIWLSWCYFMTALSKIMDVVAQYSGNPMAKVITNAKTSITDAALEVNAVYNESGKGVQNVNLKQHMGASAVYATNLSLIIANALPGAKDLPNAKWWEDLQKGLGGIIDTFKDLSALAKMPKDLNQLRGDIFQWALKANEKFAKLLDQVNKALTLYDKVPKIMPDVVKNNTPGVVKRLPTFKKETLEDVQKGLSVAKYTLEAIVNFIQCCLSLGEAWDNHKTAQNTLQRIQQQTSSSGIGVQLGPDMFADATQKDMIELIHRVNSAMDARDLGGAAIAGYKQAAEEIKRIHHSLERRRYLGDQRQKGVEQKTDALKETGKRLETYRETLARDLSDKTMYGSGNSRSINWSGTKSDVVKKIDEALWKIGVFTGPYVPRYVAGRSRLGPRVSPM
jgi:prefoldin subunit 5